MHIVTGGAGFIGSNLVRALTERGCDDVVVVDDLTDGHKFVNLSDLAIVDYLDKDEFLQRLASDKGFAKGIRPYCIRARARKRPNGTVGT